MVEWWHISIKRCQIAPIHGLPCLCSWLYKFGVPTLVVLKEFYQKLLGQYHVCCHTNSQLQCLVDSKKYSHGHTIIMFRYTKTRRARPQKLIKYYFHRVNHVNWIEHNSYENHSTLNNKHNIEWYELRNLRQRQLPFISSLWQYSSKCKIKHIHFNDERLDYVDMTQNRQK